MANTFMSDSLRLRYIELLLEDNIEGAKMRFAQLTKPEEFSWTNNLSDIQQDGGYFTQKSIKTPLSRRCKKRL